MSQATIRPRSVQPVRLDVDSRELAEAYDATSIHQLNNGKTLIETLQILIGEQVLDIGAGTGRLGAYVADLVGPAGKVIGIDPLPTRVEISRRRATDNFESRVGRAEDLSQFADATFDVVYLNSVFHWVDDKPRALAEIFRVLKPGGRLGLNSAIPHHPHQFRQLVVQALAQHGDAANFSTSNPETPEALQTMVTRAGFVDYRAVEHTLVDLHSDLEQVIAWSIASAFGNFPLNQGETAQLLETVAGALETRRTPHGIRLERYLLFVTARRPLLPAHGKVDS